ncbi:MAG: SDR family oxidoreductase [Planctomycetaceae bacterium]
MSQETVVITGASSGIGEGLARRFAAEGSQLILVARSVDRLEKLADELRQRHGCSVRVIPKDLSHHGAAKELFDEIQQESAVVDVLINNAGFGQMDLFERIPFERHTDMLELNVVALTQLTRLFLPGMIERKRGQILNVGSTASFQPGPNASVYYASKAYVLSFSEGLAEELRGTGVTVTCLCPGPTKTGFGDEADMNKTLLFKLAMPLEPVVRGAYSALRKGKTVLVTGIQNKFGALSVRFMPRFVVRKLLKAMQPVAPRTPRE